MTIMRHWIVERVRRDMEGYEWRPRVVAWSVVSTVFAAGFLVRYLIHLGLYGVVNDIDSEPPDEYYLAVWSSPVGANPDIELYSRVVCLWIAAITFMVEPINIYAKIMFGLQWSVLALDLPVGLIGRVIRDG